jgi:transcriptional regulator with XRE-family HTH domain
MKVKLGERIRKARTIKGLSQQNMADDLDLSVASYSNIERGITDINVSRLLEISQILKIDVTELLKEQEESKNFHDDGLPYLSPEMSGVYKMLEKQQNEIETLKRIVQELIAQNSK